MVCINVSIQVAKNCYRLLNSQRILEGVGIGKKTLRSSRKIFGNLPLEVKIEIDVIEISPQRQPRGKFQRESKSIQLQRTEHFPSGIKY
jgi:hypothetical protein